MINNKIIKKISENGIYLIDNNFFIDVYFNTKSSSFNKAKFIKACFLPIDFNTDVVGWIKDKPIHLDNKLNQNKKSYANASFLTNRKNEVQSKFYSKNIIKGNLQKDFKFSLIEKNNEDLSSVIKNTIKINKYFVTQQIPSDSKGFIFFVYILDKNKKILEIFTIKNKLNNIYDDFMNVNEATRNDIILSYSKGVDISFEEYTIVDNRIDYLASGPVIFIPGYSNENTYDRRLQNNTLRQNNLNIELKKDNASISMSTSELFDSTSTDSQAITDNNVLLRQKILFKYDNNIIKNLRNSIKSGNLEKSSLDLKIRTDAGCYTKSIEVSKNKAYSLYNAFLIRHKDRYMIENFRGKYTDDYVNVDGNSDDGVLKHNFIPLDAEFLKSIIMNQTKFITIEFWRPNLNNKLCFYLDDTLNPQNKITPYLIENGNKAVYLIDTLYRQAAYYTPFRNGIKSIFCNNIQVYPENLVQDSDEAITTTNDNDYLNASNIITDSIISVNADENTNIFLDRSLIEKSQELFLRLKYETDDSGIIIPDLLSNTLVKTTSTFISGGGSIERVSYDKLSNNISNVSGDLYGIRLASTESSTMTTSMSFIVFEKGTLSSLYDENPTDVIKESYCKTLNNIIPKNFSIIDKSISNLSIRSEKNNQLEFEKIFNAIDGGKTLKKKTVTIKNIENNLQINPNQTNAIEDKESVKKEILIENPIEELIKNYGNYTINKKFYSSNVLLEYENKAFCITRKSKSNSNILSIDLLLLKKELDFNIIKKDLQIYYHANLGFEKNNKLSDNKEVKLNSYLVDNEYSNFTQLFKFDIINDKLSISIEEKILNFNKEFYEKSNELFVDGKKLILKNILQRFLFIFENQGKEEYFTIEDNVTPSVILKDKFKSQNKDNLNIDLNQKHIKQPNIIVKMV